MVDKYIKELLIEHGRVYIPNLGLIYKDYKSNDSSDPYTISQPTPQYLLDGEYRNDDDTWLAYAVARGEHVTLEDAEVVIREYVEKTKESLASGQSVEIEGVGTFVNEGGILTFANTNLGYNSDENFGIPNQISLETEESDDSYRDSYTAPASYYEEPPVTESYNEPEESGEIEEEENDYDEEQEEEDNFNELPEKKSSKFGWAAAAAIILMLGFGALYYFYLMPQSEGEDPVASIDQQEVDTSAEDSTQVAEASIAGSTPESNTSSVKPLSVPEAGKRYYIIAGAFSMNENAEKLKRKLKSKGVTAKVLRSKDSQQLFRVSLADFDNFDQALAKTEALKGKHGTTIWILKY